MIPKNCTHGAAYRYGNYDIDSDKPTEYWCARCEAERLQTEAEKQKTTALAWKRRYKNAVEELSKREEQIEIAILKDKIEFLEDQNGFLSRTLANIYTEAEQALKRIEYFSPQGQKR